MDWTREELSASVVAYIEMRDFEQRGEKFVKKRFYEALSERFDRSPKAFEYRMQNISYVYSVLGRQWVSGLKPAKNVGANVLPVIEELIFQHEGVISTPKVEFEEQVSKLRREKTLPKPQGSKSPQKQSKETTSYDRDPEVVAWILKKSGGICESCENPAPFVKPDGDFYLEVHHLRRLADGGSDTVTNAVAVCPNCHRELHYGSNRENALKHLYLVMERLERE
ncbi:MAG: HNH endonuclease [Nitrospiraceae bacterium]|nr:HNH endonuclease [Nitrospiraceae bacterium]